MKPRAAPSLIAARMPLAVGRIVKTIVAVVTFPTPSLEEIVIVWTPDLRESRSIAVPELEIVVTPSRLADTVTPFASLDVHVRSVEEPTSYAVPAGAGASVAASAGPSVSFSSVEAALAVLPQGSVSTTVRLSVPSPTAERLIVSGVLPSAPIVAEPVTVRVPSVIVQTAVKPGGPSRKNDPAATFPRLTFVGVTRNGFAITTGAVSGADGSDAGAADPSAGGAGESGPAPSSFVPEVRSTSRGFFVLPGCGSRGWPLWSPHAASPE